MKTRMIKALVILTFAAAIVGGVWVRFHVWRLVHPDAPTWTFFFDS